MPFPSVNQLIRAFQIPNNITIVAGKFYYGNKPLVRNSQSFEISNVDNSDLDLGYTSILNTPVYTNIEFLPGSYTNNVQQVFNFGSDVDGPERLRYEAVLITVSQAKKIIKTEIQGRDGTVKEYIGMDDFQVTVNGIISGANGNRPVAEVAALKRMLVAPIAIKVASAYLQNLDISDLVVDSYQLGELEGSYSYQPFSINFISDVPQELILMNS